MAKETQSLQELVTAETRGRADIDREKLLRTVVAGVANNRKLMFAISLPGMELDRAAIATTQIDVSQISAFRKLVKEAIACVEQGPWLEQ